MSDATVTKGCAARKGGVPAGCATLIDTAVAMMRGPERALGRKILEDLLQTAMRTGCGTRPNCHAVVQRITRLLETDG